MRVRLLVVAALATTAATLATPASACQGPVCDKVNEVCVLATTQPCVRS